MAVVRSPPNTARYSAGKNTNTKSVATVRHSSSRRRLCLPPAPGRNQHQVPGDPTDQRPTKHADAYGVVMARARECQRADEQTHRESDARQQGKRRLKYGRLHKSPVARKTALACL